MLQDTLDHDKREISAIWAKLSILIIFEFSSLDVVLSFAPGFSVQFCKENRLQIP